MKNLVITDSQKDIMEKIPDSLARIGIFIVFVIVLILLFLSIYIRYPDTLNGQAVLNSTKPSVKLVMPTTGKLILVADIRKLVQENEIIAFIDNPANYNDVIYLKNMLADFHKLEASEYNSLCNRLTTNLELGEIKSSYMKFLISLKAMSNQSDIHIYNNEIRSLTDRLNANISNSYKKETIHNTSKNRLYYFEQTFIGDSMLLEKGVISKNEFEISKSIYLQQKIQHQESALNYKMTEDLSQNLINEITKIKLQKNRTNEIVYNTLIESYVSLITLIEIWEKNI